MIGRAVIIAEYERREADAGGLAKANPQLICRDVAGALGITTQEVEAVMLDWWAKAGSG